MKLTKAQANAVWDILVHYGANENKRESFVSYLTQDATGGHEFRFGGIFGMGGKLRLRAWHGLTADYYYEDETPSLNMKMRSLNTELSRLSVEFELV
jgi:hypothetical protein